MKKQIILLLILFGLPLGALAANKYATVFNPLTYHRKTVEVGDPNAFNNGYQLETENIYDMYFNPDRLIGAKPIRPSGFETTLSSSLAEEGNETTLVVNSLTLPDDTTLNDSYYGDLLILTVGEGDSEEKIAVSALNESTLTFTVTSRGLEYGRWASSTSNMHQHLPGERVYVSNDDHFLYQQYYALEGEQTTTGTTTFSGQVTFSGNVIIPDYTSSDTTYAANIDYVNNVATSGVADASETVSGKSELATQNEMAAGTNTGGSGTNLVLQSQYASSTPDGVTVPITESDGDLNAGFIGQDQDYTWSGDNTYNGTTTFSATTTFSGSVAGAGFGGDGSDGALSITSGTTTIDLNNAAVVTKQYTSISITGTGVLTFSNPHADGTIIILKSQGNVTLTSSNTPMINAVGIGAEAGSNGQFLFDSDNHYGVAGADGSNNNSGNGGAKGAAKTGGAIISTVAELYTTSIPKLYTKTYHTLTGSGGNTGGDGGVAYQDSASSDANGGTGGRGGGCVIIEVGGAINYTTANGISVAGANGSAGADGNGDNIFYGGAGGAGGGGGGAGGIGIILYNEVTATSTIQIKGGDGGDGGNGEDGDSGSDSTNADLGGAGGGSGASGGGYISSAGGNSGAGGDGGDSTADGESGNNGSNGSAVGSTSGGSGGTGGSPTSGEDYEGAGGGGGGGGGAGATGYSIIAENLYF